MNGGFSFMPRIQTILCLVLILGVGLWLRLANRYPYKFYPDAYQSLLVAKNIQTYHSAIGTLGSEGKLYPNLFMWTRPIYPLFILSLSAVTDNEEHAALVANLLAGSLTILLVFFFVQQLFHSEGTGLAASLLLAISFNHAIWGGFILTETVGVFFLALMLWSLFKTSISTHRNTLFSGTDTQTGIYFALAILTRYEYIILAIPLLLFIWTRNRSPYAQTITLIIASLLPVAIVFSILLPLRSVIPAIAEQVADLTGLGVFIGIVTLLVYQIVRKAPGKKLMAISDILSAWSIYIIWSAGIVMTAYAVLSSLHILPTYPVGILNFFRTDIPISFCSLIGITTIMKSRETRSYAFFILFSCVLLLLVYTHVNLQIQRYSNNLLPFLIIPAAAGLTTIIRYIRSYIPIGNSIFHRSVLSFTVFGFILVIQVMHVHRGIKGWNNGAWIRRSYEETSSRLLSDHLGNSDQLLIAALPEPYYYFTSRSTRSVSDFYPYIYIDEALNDRSVTVILDMAMRDIFPNFTLLVENRLQQYRRDTYLVGEAYRYTTYTAAESHPVQLYSLPLYELKREIESGAGVF